MLIPNSGFSSLVGDGEIPESHGPGFESQSELNFFKVDSNFISYFVLYAKKIDNITILFF